MIYYFKLYPYFIGSTCRHRCIDDKRREGFKCTRGRLGQTTNTIFALGKWNFKIKIYYKSSIYFNKNIIIHGADISKAVLGLRSEMFSLVMMQMKNTVNFNVC